MHQLDLITDLLETPSSETLSRVCQLITQSQEGEILLMSLLFSIVSHARHITFCAIAGNEMQFLVLYYL